MTPIYCSFFTAGTEYEAEAMLLEQTVKQFGLPVDIRSVPDLGEWVLNCGYKPTFIRDRMADYPGRPIVWLDADARMRQRPVLFETMDCDFAAHWRHGSELLSGTMYFGATPAAWSLVNQWIAVQKATPREWDQRCLQWLLEEFPGRWRIERLPAGYTRVFDDSKMGEPVIAHYQASRRLAKGEA